MAARRSTPGLFEILQEADLPQFYNDIRSSLRVCHVQQLKYVNDDDLATIGMTKADAQRLRTAYNKYCPPNYVTKLKKLLLPTWTKDEFLLDDEASSETVPSPPSTSANVSMPLPSLEAVVNHQGVEIKVPRQHLISPEAIQIQKELGTGEFGVVQQGVWMDQEGQTHQVAIKSLSKERMQNSTVEFMKEYEIMQTIQHENIVSLFGVVLDSSRIMIITELAPLRSLLECLKEPGLRSTLTVVCLASFSRQICAGMKYLEQRRLIHRDLAARNILVFSRDLVKVSDFGLSRALGVGKDYYQTNFNMNLKLPIAWCAPECITFLKFTSASDIWAFGVTMWEMFSYGFQPWAAQTGQQILEAIDEPNCHRLERPLHCPIEFYQIMLRCWKHEPHLRPTFAQLCSILEDTRPEQVAATCHSDFHYQQQTGYLAYNIGNVITVLDKNVSGHDDNKNMLWSGVRDDNGCVGLFDPTKVVTYLGTIPKSRRSSADGVGRPFSIFGSATLRKESKKRLSREIISSSPHHGNFQHKTSLDSSFGLDSSSRLARLSRFDSETSDMAPLISTRSLSTTQLNQSTKPANRMGHTIGYIRERSSNASFGVHSAKSNELKSEKHEYHSISDHEDNEEEDDEFFKPLDLGPSLLDEVFGELGSSSSMDASRKDASDHESSRKSEHKKDLKELVSNTLHLRRHKKKQFATVRPIKASDERALESAIAMATALASKSMHDIDKRTGDQFFDHSPARSPITPNSPAKKFSFHFPSVVGNGSKSPKAERKPFSAAAGVSTDLVSSLSDQEKNAYRALVGESESLPPLTKLSSPSSISQSMACFPSWSNDHFLQQQQLSPPPSIPAPLCPVSMNNPLPLPPKSQSISRAASNPPKRHVRKNPLIVPSAMVSNMLRNETSRIYGNVEHKQQPLSLPSPKNYADMADDEFERALESDIDALDAIVGEGGEEALFSEEASHYESCPTSYKAVPFMDHQQDENDEVRIMMKVMGRSAQAEDCLAALKLTSCNIHHAIKLVKLKNLIKVKHVTDEEMLATLENEGWEVAKAAGHIMKTRLQ